jgi:23S rRNA G2445 N2-methylase RlmL
VRQWREEPDGESVQVRLQIIRSSGFVGIQLPCGSLNKRAYRVATLPGSLDPTIAYCLARLTQPIAGDIFLDPMCGAGTVAIERRLSWPCRRALCGDIACEAVQCAAKNAEAADLPLKPHVWDARELPLADWSVNKIAVNLPYGKDVPLEAPEQFFPALVSEWRRIMQPGGTLVALTNDADTFTQAALCHRDFRLRQRLSFRLRGFRSAILVFVR